MSIANWAQMATDVARVRGDNEVSVVFRRGDSTLSAQSVRVERIASAAAERDSTGAQQAVGRVHVLGGTDLDIEPGDRFNDGNGVLYEVVLVRPNQLAGVMAEARQVE